MNNKELWVYGIFIGIIVIGVVGVIFGIYAFIALLDWVFSDPFDWITNPSTPSTHKYVEPLDFQLCREKGGIPIKSNWDGSIKRCDNLQ